MKRLTSGSRAASTFKLCSTVQSPRSFHKPFHHTSRSLFIDDLLRTATGAGEPRILKANRRVPYDVATLFKIIASVDEYPTFLPFIHSSKVLSRDRRGWPARATLTVGYSGYKESFTSQIDCDEELSVVRARSGDRIGDDRLIKHEGLFKTLDSMWKFSDVSTSGKQESEATLNVKVQFRNPVYDAFLGAVEDKVANTMIEAFEARLREIKGK
ncbi:hypothetical protein UCRPC4_g00140 [Phaeomoniella chlamydospora]|uniref:Coenzyme Q-binding protein COQ10 START domain-containing protein n=1 Tax=Phaeomoniella chlamydospora TaxID=158046 RepID=A0A0G2H196_PHACM|nr:hypothetical protein UCRPC4_g00140 [Phaeomoniella chlamydospora]